MSKKEIKAVEDHQNAMVAAGIDFAADAGQGMEGADAESFAIPFLAILQGLSPQIETVDGAKPGLLINTVTNELMTEAVIVPVAFARRYLRWGDRDAGEKGFRGEFLPSEVQKMLSTGEAYEEDRGRIRVRTEGARADDILRDTRQHYVLIVSEDGTWTPAIMGLTSTMIKKSKNLMAQISNFTMTSADGKRFNPPSFARKFRITTEKETNDHGTWYSPNFSVDGMVDDPQLYEAAKAFHKQVATGEVIVDHDSAEGGREKASDDEGF